MWILVMPIRTLTGIKRPKRDKIILMAIFGVGALSCLARLVFDDFEPVPTCLHIHSIIRLYTIRIYAESKDPFYDGAPINTWSMVEVNIAIVCASVPGKILYSALIKQTTD
jgi:hypothetical protein